MIVLQAFGLRWSWLGSKALQGSDADWHLPKRPMRTRDKPSVFSDPKQRAANRFWASRTSRRHLARSRRDAPSLASHLGRLGAPDNTYPLPAMWVAC